MLSLSCNEAARRSTWTCLSCATLPRTSQALIAMSSRPLAAQGHQRKHSSSKTPSSPNDDSRAITAPAEAPTTEAKPVVKEGAERRSSTRLGRRKYKDSTQEVSGKPKSGTQQNLPSVPATRHLPPAGGSHCNIGPILTSCSPHLRYPHSIIFLNPQTNISHRSLPIYILRNYLLLNLQPQKASETPPSRRHLHHILRSREPRSCLPPQ